LKNKNVLTTSDHGLMLINRNDTAISKRISETGNWELDYIDFLKLLITKCYPQGSEIEIIDAGANLGVYTLSMARIAGLKVKVIAIEAQRLLFQILNANVALNSLDNVWTHHRIISDTTDATVELQCPDLNIPANFGAFEVDKNLVYSDYDGASFLPAEKVKTMTLDSLGLTKCAFLKLDVEGMEDSALLGADTLLSTSRPIIFFERHKTDYGKVISILRKHSYSIWELPGPNVLAVRKEWDLQLNNLPRIDL
jgi:FkbM family methyltransferase